MINLASPAVIKEVMSRFSVAPLKQLGQNFLCDAHILSTIADSARCEGQAVLEIGAGLGALTQQLALRAKKVVTVEIDRGMIEVLKYTLADFDNIEVCHGDILKQDLYELHQKLGGGEFVVCANLPYYITTAVIMRLLESNLPCVRLCFLIQKEVAERMMALPGRKSYGSLSIAVQYYTQVEIVASVPPSCFVPSPSVDSRVICLTRREPEVRPVDEATFFKLTRAAFAMRRKTLVNNLIVAGFGLSKAQAEELLARASLSPAVRGEALSLAEFARLSDELCEMTRK